MRTTGRKVSSEHAEDDTDRSLSRAHHTHTGLLRPQGRRLHLVLPDYDSGARSQGLPVPAHDGLVKAGVGLRGAGTALDGGACGVKR